MVTWNPNMFTLIGLGVTVSYAYSPMAALFPRSLCNSKGHVDVYFEASAVIVTLVLLGQVMELPARSRINTAIKALLGPGNRSANCRGCSSIGNSGFSSRKWQETFLIIVREKHWATPPFPWCWLLSFLEPT